MSWRWDHPNWVIEEAKRQLWKHRDLLPILSSSQNFVSIFHLKFYSFGVQTKENKSKTWKFIVKRKLKLFIEDEVLTKSKNQLKWTSEYFVVTWFNRTICIIVQVVIICAAIDSKLSLCCINKKELFWIGDNKQFDVLTAKLNSWQVSWVLRPFHKEAESSEPCPQNLGESEKQCYQQ